MLGRIRPNYSSLQYNSFVKGSTELPGTHRNLIEYCNTAQQET